LGVGKSFVNLRLAIQGDQRIADLPAHSTLRRWVRLALEDSGDAEITLRFVDTRESRRINRRFRHKDHATNVLTFDYTRLPWLSADIVLCLPVIDREARDQGKSRRAHLAHMVIHAVLHARGFDHVRASDMRRMEGREIDLLFTLRIGNPYGAVRR
jgi:probable rRNA maturation factor